MPTDTHVALVNGLRVHYLRAGGGPAVILLHGWPQTSHCWRLVLPELARTHTVIVPDMRGYGRTDKPTTGYDKRTMASDMSALVTSLGLDTVSVIGHDRGGRVAHRWALDRPEQVNKIAVLDIAPTREMWRRWDTDIATGYWHWLFHLQPDLPELLAGANLAAYLRYFFERWTVNRHAFDDATIDEYVRAFSAPGALRAGFDDYRAAPLDDEHDNADAAAGRTLGMPLLALWGAEGRLAARLPIEELWRAYADNVTAATIPDCGHFLPEERPEETLAHLREFLAA